MLSALAMAFFLAAPARYAESVREGVSLWAANVLPAIFPFLFLASVFVATPLFSALSRLLSKPMKGVFRVSGEGGCVAVLAAVSGYPVGARAVAELAGRGLKKEERLRLACLVTTSGPAFLVGVVGSAMAKNSAAGWLLLLCHLLGVWTVSFFARFFAKKGAERTPLPPPVKSADGSALLSSVLAILCVGGSIALFHAFGQMAADLLPEGTPPYIAALLRGLLEMTTGCAYFAPLGTPAALAACAFFVTFGGACVLVQQAAFLRPAGVKFAPFAAIKLLQGGAAALYCLLFGTLLL